MATKTSFKLILASARDFVDFVVDALITQRRDNQDSGIEVSSLMTRAKKLVNRDGVLYVKTTSSDERDTNA